jgi:hypothetical protein
MIKSTRVIVLLFPGIAVLAIAVASAQGTTFGDSDSESIPIPLAQILALPADYQGQRVRTFGVATFGFETNGLYLNRDRMGLGTANAIWLEISIPELTLRDLEPLSARYVMIEGKLNANNRGHRGAYVATLEDINLVADWQMSGPIKLSETSASPDAYAGAFVAVRELVETAGVDADEMHLSFLCGSNTCEFAVYPAEMDDESFEGQRGCPAEYYCADLKYDIDEQRFSEIVHWR